VIRTNAGSAKLKVPSAMRRNKTLEILKTFSMGLHA